jgi:hypothetical protein
VVQLTHHSDTSTGDAIVTIRKSDSDPDSDAFGAVSIDQVCPMPVRPRSGSHLVLFEQYLDWLTAKGKHLKGWKKVVLVINTCAGLADHSLVKLSRWM